jgi:Holliday junction resolvase
MLESKIQTHIKKRLEKYGWLVVKCITMSRPGWPDLMAFKFSQTFFLEIKQPGEHATPLQKYVHDELRKKGFTVVVATKLDDVDFMC